MKLGEKIKALRKAANRTQASLAGEEITRNMLCRIEKGTALPSLRTLLYLSEELGVPLSYLLDDEEDSTAYFKRQSMPKISALFHERNYNECYRLCESLPGEPDDEIALILSKSALECGKEAFRSGNMETALVFFNEAVLYAQKTAYPTSEILASATLFSAISGNVSAPRRDFRESAYLEYAALSSERELYAYLSDDTAYPYRNPLFAMHQEAREKMKEKKYYDALQILSAAEEKKGSPDSSAYFLFRLYSDMELCYREIENFEKAYQYSSKRVTLLSAFQS